MKLFTEVWILAFWEDEQSTSAHKASDVNCSVLEVGAMCTVPFGQKKYDGQVAAFGKILDS